MRKLVLTPKLLNSQLSKCFNPNSISHRPSVTGIGRTGRVKIGFEIEPSVFGEDDLFLEFHCCFARFIQFFNGKLKNDMIGDDMPSREIYK